jgi:hypothetical protein
VPARCAKVESSLTQKLRRDNVKHCRGSARSAQSQRREKFENKTRARCALGLHSVGVLEILSLESARSA